MMKQQAAAIIPAAGSGSRMQASCPKQYLELAGKPILIHTITPFYDHPDIANVVVVVPGDMIEETRELLAAWGLTDKTEVIAGGLRRQDSVKAGLEHLDDSVTTVLVHDGARPLITGELISRCLEASAEYGAAIAAIPVKDTLKKADVQGCISATVDRSGLWAAQTPQASGLQQLLNAFSLAGNREFTDEASLLEHAGYQVALVPGSETNIKITRPEDLTFARTLLMQNISKSPRIGHGFDAHKLVTDRALILGGVSIEHDMGLAGHSDADVVTHALCDAILGALGQGDIGKHFPDSSAEFKDIYSIKLLEKVVATMGAEGFRLGNGDLTIVCQAPKLAPHIETMRKTLAKACRVDAECLNIKATTTEKMGYTGRQEGISCHAVVLLTALSGQ